MRGALLVTLLFVGCTRPSPDALLAKIAAAHEDYDLDTYYATSRTFLDRFEEHPEYDGVRYRLAEQMVANSLLEPQSEEAKEARRMLARAAKDAKTAQARFDAALLLLKFRPNADPIAEAEAMFRRFEDHPGLEQVYFWVVAKLEEEGRLAEAATYAKRLLERYPNVEGAPTYRALVRRAALVGRQAPFGDALDDAQREQLEGKVVLVDFWATWCAPCVEAMPRIVAFHRDRSSDGFELVQVSLDEDDAAYARFVEEHELVGIQLRSTGDDGVDERFGVEVLPSYVVVARDGDVTNVQSSDAGLFTLLKRMLATARPAPR